MLISNGTLVVSDKTTLLQIDPKSNHKKEAQSLLTICWQQWLTERRLSKRGIFFRTTDSAKVKEAYSAMTLAEFDAINGPQSWANWRTIAAALHKNVPDRPLKVLDLGSGSGKSTEVLAYHCPRGTQILGYELSDSMIEMAKQRHYHHSSGQKAGVNFRCQGITDTWRKLTGEPILAESIDLVSSTGVIGHHLTNDTVLPLIKELNRVLSPTGLALLDVGPSLKEKRLVDLMSQSGFLHIGRYRSSWLDLQGQVAFRHL